MDPQNQNPPTPAPNPTPAPAPEPNPTPAPEAAPPPTDTPVSANAQAAKKSNKLIVIIIIIVVLLLLVGGGAYALMMKNHDKKKTNTPVAASNSTSQTAQASTSSEPKCLNISDFPVDQGATSFDSAAVFFKADSTEYQYPDQLDENLKPILGAYNKYKDRKFKIAVNGSVRKGDNKSSALAQARAEKVIGELAKRNIPQNLLYVGKLEDSSSFTSYDLFANDPSNRNANIQFDLCQPTDPNYVAPS